jgi:hypothetical protein
MGMADWTELENLSGEIADSQSRLAAARATQNHGLVKLLERQISEAEKWRDRLVQQITSRLTIPGTAARGDRAPAPPDPQLEAVSETAAPQPLGEPAAELALAELAVAIAEPVTSAAPGAPVPDRLEGVASVWEQLSRTDIDRVKRELSMRRAEMLTRHAEELRALDAEQSEIDAFEQAIEAFARKFNVAGGEVVVPFEERKARG